MEGMRSDHCDHDDSDKDFDTLNYGLTTTARKEWNIVVTVDKTKEIGGRVIPDYRVLLTSENATRAEPKLEDCEIVATILYTGPMVLLLFYLSFISDFSSSHCSFLVSLAVSNLQYGSAPMAQRGLFGSQGKHLCHNDPLSCVCSHKNIARNEDTRRVAPISGAWGHPAA
jgi:hypothetical protein